MSTTYLPPCPRCGLGTNRLGICPSCANAAEGIVFDRVFRICAFPFRLGGRAAHRLAERLAG